MEVASSRDNERLRRRGRRRQICMALNPVLLRYRRLAGPILYYWLKAEELQMLAVEKNYGHWVRVAKDRWLGQIAAAQFTVAALATGLLFGLALLLGGK